MRTAIIGAGISGLTTAYYLKQQGCDVVVFEKENRVGGSMVTEQQDGFLIDLGPNSTLETSQVLRDLIDAIGLSEQKVYANELSNKRFVVRNGQLYALPISPPAFLKTKLFSLKAKLQLLKEPFIPKVEAEDISLADYVRYRLGEEFLDYAINPFVAGVYAGDPENLSAPAGFPKLFNLEQKYGSFIKGAIKGKRERQKRQEVAKDRAKMFSFLSGMQTFADALAKILAPAIQLQSEVLEVLPAEKGFKLMIGRGEKEEEHRFERVVVSVPTYVQAKILKAFLKGQQKLLEQVAYPPVAVVFMGFNRSAVNHPLDGFGFLLPAKEKRQILGSIFSSTIFPGRAPQGKVAFTTFVGGMRNPDNALKDAEQLKPLVLQDLDNLLGLNEEPVLTRIRRWPRAIPQYQLGYKSVQNLYDELEERYSGLYFAGNFRRGISVGDSVLSANETSEKILNEK